MNSELTREWRKWHNISVFEIGRPPDVSIRDRLSNSSRLPSALPTSGPTPSIAISHQRSQFLRWRTDPAADAPTCSPLPSSTSCVGMTTN